ncbi:MAG TPA: hypothetical protein VHI13_15295 [Candidatus Kapabacteria bacterium]|nr:hypothetical protein [Candidatus Kapabacteria bacterium]
MPQSTRNISLILRATGATIFAVVLWGIVSLSDQFDTVLDVPVSVETPADRSLVHPLPGSIKVRVRASGWSLLKMHATGRMECLLRPVVVGDTSERVIGFNRRELLASIRTDIPDAQQLSVTPDTLTMVLGPTGQKMVPLSPEVTIALRKGFLVIGGVRVQPDSVLLVGSRRALEDITRWPTAALALDDVHRPVTRTVAVSDTLRGMVSSTMRRAELYADVQEVAERLLSDVPVTNRASTRDTSLHLSIYPSHVDVLLRGGARDLSRIDPAAIRAYVQILEGADTLGITYPHLVLPPGVNASVVSIKPAHVRYLFRREIPAGNPVPGSGERKRTSR